MHPARPPPSCAVGRGNNAQPVSRYSLCMSVVFFFSSRRRHTRLQGDWSSDVCSSDLAALLAREGGTEQRWAAYHPGSGSPGKNWPVDHFATVAAGLAAHGLRPVLLEIGRASCRERV